MSQNAAAINAEIRALANRDDLDEPRVYAYMNRVKREAQAFGVPFDFMLGGMIVLMGSGTGTPGDVNDFSSDAIALPPNFCQLLYVEIVTDPVVPQATVNTIFGPPGNLFYRPTSGTFGNFFPLFNIKGDEWITDLGGPPRETIIPDILSLEAGSEAGFVSGEVADRNAGFPPLPSDARPRRTAKALVTGNNRFNYHLGNLNLATAGYATNVWDGKFLQFRHLPRLNGFPYVVVLYYRFLPDYDEPDFEMDGAPIPAEDIFTRTAEDVLIFGSMKRISERYFDETRARYYDAEFRKAEARFRVEHQAAQHGMKRLAADRRIPFGDRRGSIFREGVILT